MGGEVEGWRGVTSGFELNITFRGDGFCLRDVEMEEVMGHQYILKPIVALRRFISTGSLPSSYIQMLTPESTFRCMYYDIPYSRSSCVCGVRCLLYLCQTSAPIRRTNHHVHDIRALLVHHMLIRASLAVPMCAKEQYGSDNSCLGTLLSQILACRVSHQSFRRRSDQRVGVTPLDRH